MRRYVVLFEKSENGYSAYVPDLPGCVAFGDTKEETEELIYEAIRLHLEDMEEAEERIPQSVTDSEIMVF